MFGLFKNPNCPRCGTEVVETGYSAPYPAYRCLRCSRENAQLQREDDRAAKLEKRIKQLEEKLIAEK